MRSTFVPLAFAALAAANPMPQGVASAIAPPTSAPDGCQPDYAGTFQIQVVNVTSSSAKRSYQKRQDGTLLLTLQGGVLTDQQGRTGYIADNRQFQFDAPAQSGAIYTAGWSACSNGSLAIGGDAIFQQCLSGTFYNLYDENAAAQCSPIYIEIINGGTSGGAASTQAASDIGDGQVTANPVTQIGDGQIQNPTGAPITQISDGQVQATTSGAPVTQISDGQPQASVSTASPVRQISDGQVQNPTGSPVTQISDGQIQSPTNGTVASPTIQPYAGAAPSLRAEAFGLAVGVLAVAML